MRLLRRFPVLAFALVFLSIVALALAQQSITLLLVAGALAAISWYVTEGPRGRSLPKWVSHILVVAVALYTAAELVQGLNDVHGVLGRFGLWLTLIKLYERNTARDHGHLLMLSFLLMLVACLHGGGLLFSIILVAYVVLGVYVLLLYQLYASHERARSGRAQSMPSSGGDVRAPAALPPVKPIIGQHVAMNFRWLTAGVGVVGLLLGCVVFVAFPRGVLEDAVSTFNISGNRGRTGFTTEVNLMRGGRITESRRSVMTVQLLDQAGQPMQFYEPLRLRGAVFNRYEGNGAWQRGREVLRTFDVRGDEFTNLAPIEPEPNRTLTQVVRTRTEADALFSMYAPVAVSADRSAQLGFDSRSQLVRLVEPSIAPLTYRIKIQPTPTDAIAQYVVDDVASSGRRRFRRLHDERVAELATEVIAEAGLQADRPALEDDPVGYWQWARDTARALSRYLQSPEFRYTLNLDFTVDGDPIQHFLFEAKRGHCEYFASALVALCENIGVESRLIAGYLASEYNEFAERYDVLERNAHAWVEVRTGDRRWSAFDPTPPAALEAITSEPATVGERVQSLYERIDAMWSYNVLGYNSRTQDRLAARWDLRPRQRLSNLKATIEEWFLVVNAAFSLGPAGSIYVAFVVCILILAVFVLVKLMRRSRKIRRIAHLEHLRKRGPLGFWEREYQRLLRDAGFYVEMLEAIERKGMEKPAWMPPLAYAEQLAREHPPIGKVVHELTSLFYRSRYGHAPLTAEEVANARRQVAELAMNRAPIGNAR